jgi:hypothetical protein
LSNKSKSYSGNETDLINITPKPIFAFFIGGDDRMESLVVVACSMFVFGIITATHIPTLHTETKVHPNVTNLQAIFTTIS